MALFFSANENKNSISLIVLMFVLNACMAATASSEPATGWQNSSNERHHSLMFAGMELVMRREKGFTVLPTWGLSLFEGLVICVLLECIYMWKGVNTHVCTHGPEESTSTLPCHSLPILLMASPWTGGLHFLSYSGKMETSKTPVIPSSPSELGVRVAWDTWLVP